MPLTLQEALAAKARAESYPQGTPSGAWGFGPLAKPEFEHGTDPEEHDYRLPESIEECNSYG